MSLLVTIPVAGGALVYSYTVWEDRPQKQNELWDVAIGDSKQDVIFKKGVASKFISAKTDPNLWVYALNPDGSTRSTVKEGDSSVTDVYAVGYASNRVRYVEKFIGDLPTLPTLGEIGGYSTLDDIEKELGQPSSISRSADQTTRFYSFDRYNVEFAFEKGKMQVEVVYDSKLGPLKFDHEAK